jgi:N-formylglutamate amidohydrolase
MSLVKTKKGNSIIVAAAIHNGHSLRPELLPYCQLTETERLREEDPFTGEWVKICDNQIRVQPSRFEVDINRPREKAVYINPQDAWGLNVWSESLPASIIENSLQRYDEIYAQLAVYFDTLLSIHKRLIIYDLHSYNHRREGYDKYAPVEENPEVNIGTANINKTVWAPVIDTLMKTMEQYNFEGRHLSIGENIKFKGGYFGQWLQARYADLVCPIAIEFKKFFMNEWTGESNENQLSHIREMLISTLQPVTVASRKSYSLL